MSENGRQRRRLRHLLLDRPFQLRYTLAVTLAGGLIFAVMAGLFYARVRANSVLISQEAEVEVAEVLRESLAAEDLKVLWLLIGAWAAVVVALFSAGLWATHRIAGPAYVMRLALDALAQGLPVQHRPLRRGDELRSLYQRLLEVAAAVSQSRHGDRARAREVVARLEGRLDEAVSRSGLSPELAEAIRAELDPLRAPEEAE